MSEWKEYKISEISVKITSGGTPSTKVEDYYNGDIPWLNTKEVNFNRIWNTEKFITEKGLNSSPAKWIDKNSVIIAMYGATAAKVAISKIRLTTNQACCNLIIDEKKANYEFVFYYIWNKYHELENIAVGAAQQNLNVGVIANYPILMPSLPEQTAIASILSSLDSKIDLLHRQNATLEKMAETLFRQWFVEREGLNYDFGDFYNGNDLKNHSNQGNQRNHSSDILEETKEKWKSISLSKMANFLNGLACQKSPPKNEIDKLPVLKIKELSSGINGNSDWASTDVKSDYIVKNGDIIFAWSASLMVKIWDGPDCILNQHLFKVTSEEYPKWFVYLWCKHHLEEFISIAASHATTMGHIKRGDLDEAIVLIPSKEELDFMTQIVEPIIEKIISNNKQIRTLTSLRDTLLPKLMSGEVRVSEL